MNKIIIENKNKLLKDNQKDDIICYINSLNPLFYKNIFQL
jgi:hypothetical protein